MWADVLHNVKVYVDPVLAGGLCPLRKPFGILNDGYDSAGTDKGGSLPSEKDGSANPDHERNPPEGAIVLPKDECPNGHDTASKTTEQEESAQEKLDRDVVRWTKVVGLFTAALFIAAVLQFAEMELGRESSDQSTANQLSVMRAQTKAIQGQLDQMSLAQRPWVSLINVEPTSLSSDNEVGVQLWAKIAVKNVGHSPAQNVSVTADLLLDNFDPPPSQGMANACKRGRTSSGVIPGRPVFPGQTQNIDGDTPTGFVLDASRVWAARDARIKTAYIHESRELAEAWAQTLAQFPFNDQVLFVGCINYRSSDNAELYQTSFMFDVGTKEPFPLLSKDNPITQPPTPMPGDPEGVVVHPREMQRILPGNRVKLEAVLGSTFAD